MVALLLLYANEKIASTQFITKILSTNQYNLIYPVEFRSADSPTVIFNWSLAR